MSLPRRKSCVACVKAKRRCDLGFPVCQRCITRAKACIYSWAAPLQTIPPSTPQQGEVARYWPSNEVNTYHPPNPPNSVPRPLSPALSSLLDDLLQSASSLTPALRPPTPTHAHHASPPAEPPDGGAITTGSHFQARTEYAGRRFANQPLALARSGQTAFIHHTQVGSSPALQDALAASALHAVRNPANAALVRGEIARRSAMLVATTNAAVAATATSGLELDQGRDLDPDMDLLSPVQALIVYQCIRLFAREDGDFSQQAQAERDEEALRDWTSRLWRRSLRPFGDGGGGGIGWKAWVWEESVRRTVLAARMLIGVYTFLKQGWDQEENKVGPLGFTARAALWEARSAPEWNAAWARGGARLEVTMRTWHRDMRDAAPEDAEELGVILRAMMFGLEALEEWLGGGREALVRWGLRLPSVGNQIGW